MKAVQARTTTEQGRYNVSQGHRNADETTRQDNALSRVSNLDIVLRTDGDVVVIEKSYVVSVPRNR